MYLSLALASHLLFSGNAMAPNLQWHQDYAKALAKAKLDTKPLAIFVGEGNAGWQAICKEKKISEEAQKLLKQHYVCLFINRSDASNKRWVKSFKAQEKPTLILSDVHRTYIAFRHHGTLANGQLVHALKRYKNYEYHEPKPMVRPASYSRSYVPAGRSFCPT